MLSSITILILLDQKLITCSHPGCHCPDGYLGPHCELRESSEVPGTSENDPYASQQIPNFDDDSGSSSATLYVVIFSLISLCIVSCYAVNVYRRRRRRCNAAITDTLQWSAPNFRDGGSTEINFAPKRGSLQYSDDGNVTPYEDAIVVASSSSISYGDRWSSAVAIRAATHDLMTDKQTGENSFLSTMDIEDDDDNDVDSHDEPYSSPQIDIGPPLDEDGHELHNVEIV
jgi:hypothetical protein